MLAACSTVVRASETTTLRPIAAIVDGKVLTAFEVEQQTKAIRLMSGERGRKRFTRERVLHMLVEELLLYTEAERSGISVSEDEVFEYLERIAERAGGWPKLIDALSHAGMSIHEKEEDVKRMKAVRKLISMKVLPHVYVSPADVMDYYRQHPAEFSTPAVYTFRQIIVWKEGKTPAEARKKAQRVLKELKKGVPFEKAAAEFSEGPHAKEGGLWKDVEESSLRSKLAETLRHLEPGKTSGVVESDVAFHIVKLVSRKGGNLRPFEEVRRSIQKKLRRARYDEALRAFEKRLKKRTFVEIYENG